MGIEHWGGLTGSPETIVNFLVTSFCYQPDRDIRDTFRRTQVGWVRIPQAGLNAVLSLTREIGSCLFENHLQLLPHSDSLLRTSRDTALYFTKEAGCLY